MMNKHCPICGQWMSKVEDGWTCQEHGYYPSTGDKDAILRMVNDHLQGLRKVIPKKKNGFKSRKGKESLVLVWSDWHIGRLNEIKEKEVWNMKIAEESVCKIMKNVRELFEKYVKSTHLIEDIHIFILGDIVDDEKAFAMQPFRIEKTVIFQFKEATKILVKALRELAQYGLPIFVHTKSGNHKDKDTPPTSSWDNAVYIAAEIATVDDRIYWDIDYDARNIVEIRNHRYLIMHGWKAPKQVQTAYGRSKFGGWYAQYHYDVAVMGHYHHAKTDDYNGRPILYNGTIMVGDDYTEELGFDDTRPKQLMFGVSDKREITFWFGADTR